MNVIILSDRLSTPVRWSLNPRRLVWLCAISLLLLATVVAMAFVGGRQTGISRNAAAAEINQLRAELALVIGQLAKDLPADESALDVLAGYILGLSRRGIVRNRILPGVLRRLIGVFATYVPVVVLAEMMLSFLGLTGDRLSCGAMIAYGQGFIIEAPWLAIYPGFMATFVVLVLALLGWRVSSALHTGLLPRLF